MAGVDGTGAPVLQPCPSCGRADEVAGVPAVYHAGRDSVRVTTPARFDDPEETVTRSVTTSLSGALEPVPGVLTTPSPLGCFAAVLVAVSVGTFVAGAAAGHWFGDRPTATHPRQHPFDPAAAADASSSGFAFLGWISALALVAAIALFVRAAAHRSARKRLLAGREAAERLWSRGWYCRRCGTVHFRTTGGEEAVALTLQEFRATVWEAGGYGHLAERGPLPRTPRARRRA